MKESLYLPVVDLVRPYLFIRSCQLICSNRPTLNSLVGSLIKILWSTVDMIVHTQRYKKQNFERVPTSKEATQETANEQYNRNIGRSCARNRQNEGRQ